MVIYFDRAYFGQNRTYFFQFLTNAHHLTYFFFLIPECWTIADLYYILVRGETVVSHQTIKKTCSLKLQGMLIFKIWLCLLSPKFEWILCTCNSFKMFTLCDIYFSRHQQTCTNLMITFSQTQSMLTKWNYNFSIQFLKKKKNISAKHKTFSINLRKYFVKWRLNIWSSRKIPCCHVQSYIKNTLTHFTTSK